MQYYDKMPIIKAAADDIKAIFSEANYRCYLVTSWDGGEANGGTDSSIVVGLLESHMLPLSRITNLPVGHLPSFDIRLV